jgi:hypothetical protein
MPLSLLARGLGVSEIQAWYAVVGNEEFHPFLVADGSREKQVESLNLALQCDHPLVLETTSALALAKFGVLGKLRESNRRVLVSQAVIDSFQRELMELEPQKRRGEGLSVEMKEGTLVGREYSRESIDRAYAFYEGILSQLRDPNICETHGVSGGNRTVKWSMRNMLSPSAFDSLVLAQEKKAILASEDLRLRGLGKAEFAVDGIASMHLLAALLHEKVITEEENDTAMIRMSQWGYWFVPINDRILYAAYREDGFTVGSRFRLIAKQLGDPGSDLDPVVTVSAQFLKRLMLSPVRSPLGDQSVMFILSTLHRRGGWSGTERMLRLRLRRIMGLLEPQRQEIERQIAVWKRANPLAT